MPVAEYFRIQYPVSSIQPPALWMGIVLQRSGFTDVSSLLQLNLSLLAAQLEIRRLAVIRASKRAGGGGGGGRGEREGGVRGGRGMDP